jgi:hypothetical protein
MLKPLTLNSEISDLFQKLQHDIVQYYSNYYSSKMKDNFTLPEFTYCLEYKYNYFNSIDNTIINEISEIESYLKFTIISLKKDSHLLITKELGFVEFIGSHSSEKIKIQFNFIDIRKREVEFFTKQEFIEKPIIYAVDLHIKELLNN